MSGLKRLWSKLSREGHEHWWLAGSLLISAVVQLSFISKSDIWHDEGFSLMLAPHSLANVIARTARDVHPPLYYLILHVWMQLFGTSELAVRSLSTAAILGSIAVIFFLVKKLFGSGAAKTSALVMSIAPFLVRYGQEARMYALVAFWLTLATYLLVKALDSKNPKLLYIYAFIMAAALYTHYYSVFVIVVHWLYVTFRTLNEPKSKFKLGLKNKHWWLANSLIGLLFLPWLPVAYHQFTRVQGAFWIPPVGLGTLPGTVGQFLTFTNLGALSILVRLAILGVVVGLSLLAFSLEATKRASLWLLTTWAFLGPSAVFVVSIISRPIYVDRYFVFAAVAFYPLIVSLLYLKPLNILDKLRPLLIAVLVIVLIIGIHNVYDQSNHQMKAVGDLVSQQFRPGDELIAGEIYVYFDFSYFNHTGQPLKLYAPNGVNGYNESSLIYDQPQLIVRNFSDLHPTGEYCVWMIGKPGEQSYFDQVPINWHLITDLQTKDAVAHKYCLTHTTTALSLSR